MTETPETTETEPLPEGVTHPEGHTVIRVGEHRDHCPGHLTVPQVLRRLSVVATDLGLTPGVHDVAWWHATAEGDPLTKRSTRAMVVTLATAWADAS